MPPSLVGRSILALVLALVMLGSADVSDATPTKGRDAVSVGRVSCTRTETLLQTPVVGVEANGPHFQITNSTASSMRLVGPGKSVEVPPGLTIEASFRSMPPGINEVTCAPAHPGSPPPEPQSVTVEDESGVYHSPALQCPDGDVSIGWLLLKPGAKGMRGHPENLVRRLHPKILETDIVEYAGYPAIRPKAEHVLRLVRDGSTLETFSLTRGTRGWLISGTTSCSSFRV